MHHKLNKGGIIFRQSKDTAIQQSSWIKHYHMWKNKTTTTHDFQLLSSTIPHYKCKVNTQCAVYYCIMNSTVYSQPLREATWERRKTASTVVKNMRFAVQTQTVFPPSDLPFKRSWANDHFWSLLCKMWIVSATLQDSLETVWNCVKVMLSTDFNHVLESHI